MDVPTIQQAITHLLHCFIGAGKRDLQQKQSELKLKQHQLLFDVQTGWGSPQDMIARILDQEQAICTVLAEDCKHWHYMPSDHEFSVCINFAIYEC